MTLRVAVAARTLDAVRVIAAPSSSRLQPATVGPPYRHLSSRGTGFIGSHLAPRLSATHDCSQIVILDDLSMGSVDNLKSIQHLIDVKRVEFSDEALSAPSRLAGYGVA